MIIRTSWHFWQTATLFGDSIRPCLPKEQKKKESVLQRERREIEKRHGLLRGNVEEYGNMKNRKEKEWELREEFERQERSVKEGEVEQKKRQRERGREGWSNAF